MFEEILAAALHCDAGAGTGQQQRDDDRGGEWPSWWGWGQECLSDHAVMAGAVAAGLLLVSIRLGLVAVSAALAMAFARVYIAAHHPRDVAVGLLLGATVAMACYGLTRRPLTRLITGLARTRLGPLVQRSSAASETTNRPRRRTNSQ